MSEALKKLRELNSMSDEEFEKEMDLTVEELDDVIEKLEKIKDIFGDIKDKE